MGGAEGPDVATLVAVGVHAAAVILLAAVQVNGDRKAANLDPTQAPAYLRLFRRVFVTIRGAGRSVASSPRSSGTGRTVPVGQVVEHTRAMPVTAVGGQPPDVRELMRRMEENLRDLQRRETERTADEFRAEMNQRDQQLRQQEQWLQQLRDGVVTGLRSSRLGWAIVGLFLVSVALSAFAALT